MHDHERVYLGDGVYVRHAGHHVVLGVDNSNCVYLTPYVVKAFEKWLRDRRMTVTEVKDTRDLVIEEVRELAKQLAEVVNELTVQTVEYEVNRLRRQQ